MNGSVRLPEEVLSIICDHLGQDEDFDTLYNCARSTQSLADSALRNIYERHHRSFAFNQTEDDFRGRDGDSGIRQTQRTAQHYFRKWIVLWRSIVLSSLDPPTTYKPYCRYLRTLDFRNLADMLYSPHFRANQEILYRAPLSGFRFSQEKGRVVEVDTVATINRIGETVVAKAARLEEMSGHIRPGYLARWIEKTPRLKSTVLFMGDALDQNAGAAIAAHCEHFGSLTVHTWTNPDADQVFAKFLNDLKPDTLEYLQFISMNNIARESFEALARHGTLKELHLGHLSIAAMHNLDALRGCTAIEVLHLEESGMVALEILHHDVFSTVVEWLSACSKLRDITIKGLQDGPAILATVASSPNAKWTKLSLEGYIVRSAGASTFHAALADQRGLEVLSLNGNGEDTTSEQLSIMVSSICTLVNLKELILKQVSDEFDVNHIALLVSSLPELEDLWTSGGEVSADVLPVFNTLAHLKNLTLLAVTQFDYGALREFIISLNPEEQRGFQLSLLAADQNYDLSERQVSSLKELIKDHVGGSFEFVLERGNETEESDSD